MDPVASFFERTHSTLVNQDIRDALGPIVAIAQTYGITVVIILHLNKSESRDFMNRIAESHGFQALARSVMALGPDPDDPDGARGSRKVIAVTKANLVKPGAYGMLCEVQSVTLTHGLPAPIETSQLVLLGKCEVSADDLLMPSAERSERNSKREWLDEFLDGGWRKVEDIKKAAMSDGYTWKQIDHFARTRGYLREKVGYQGKWWVGDPKALVRDIPESLEPLDSFEAFGDSKAPKDSKDPKNSGVPREESLNGDDLDEFHRWEQRRLGEREDDDDES
jgi:hypothetical protein